MRCTGCNHEVHPVQEMNESGNFMSRCPRDACGVHLKAEPKVVILDSSAEVGALEAELHALKADEPSEDRDRGIAYVKQRLAQLTRPRTAPPAKTAAVPEPQIVITSNTIPAAPPPPALAGDDFVEAMRARLHKIENEARKLRAMLAVADSL